MKLREKAQEILNLYNYFTGAIITDSKGTILYYYTSPNNINSMEPDEVIGHNLLEVYPSVKKEESSIFNVLKNGIPLHDVNQHIINKKNEAFDSINSTYPIIVDNKITGAVEVYYYKMDKEIQQSINSVIPKGNSFNLYSTDDIVSNAISMNNLKSTINKVASTDSTVLIYGETGTGKEVVAQAIHSESRRAHKSFVSQNCAAIPENLLESILFGTVKGSYTDSKDKPGLFELANGGTLFLDEIHLMSWNIQAKLLKAIEEKQFFRVGGTVPIPVDVRIITALNVKPYECIIKNQLRKDLFFRLNVVRIDMPTLRERTEDIMSLTEHFITLFNDKMDKNIKGISDEVKDFFMKYKWPGNVRELKNIIECGFNFAKEDLITLEDIDSYEEEINYVKYGCNPDFASVTDLKEYMREYERSLIKESVDSTKTLVEAAETLGISKQSLNNKIRNLGISINRKEN